MIDHMKVGTKLFAAFALLCAMTATLGTIAWRDIQAMNASATDLYESHTVPLGLVASINENTERNWSDFRDLLLAYEPDEIRMIRSRIKARALRNDTLALQLSRHLETSALDSAFKEYTRIKEEHRVLRTTALEAAENGQRDRTLFSMRSGELFQSFETYRAALLRLRIIHLEEAHLTHAANQALARTLMRQLLLLGCATLLLALILGFLIRRSILTGLDRCTQMMRELAAGSLWTRIATTRRDELGTLSRDMDAFADSLLFVVEGLRRLANGDLTVDASGGASTDEIRPALQQICESLRGLVEESQRMILAQQAGSTDIRIDPSRFQGSYAELAAGMNRMVDDLHEVNRRTVACVARFGQGDFDAPLEPFPGRLRVINNWASPRRRSAKSSR